MWLKLLAASTILCGAVLVRPNAPYAEIAPGATGAKPRAAVGPRCKTFKGEMVHFGERATRDIALQKLDEEIAAHRAKPGNETARESIRSIECKLYLKALNEYECTAVATLCKQQ
jgi:hypothetical protein